MKHSSTSWWNSLACSMIHLTFAIWSRVPLRFRNPVCTSSNSHSTIFSILLCIIFRKILIVWEIYVIVRLFSHTLASPFLGIGMNTEHLQSSGHWFVSQICVHNRVVFFIFESSFLIDTLPREFNCFILIRFKHIVDLVEREIRGYCCCRLRQVMLLIFLCQIL